MSNLSSGAYRPGDTVLHRLDAAIKLICFLLLLVAVLTTDTPAGYTGMLLFTVAAAYLAELDRKRALSGVRQFWWLISLIIISNFVFYAPEETFGAWWVFTPSYPGLYKGISVALRVAMLLILVNVLSSTTPSLKLTGAFETVLSPLSILHVPVDRLISVMELSARLIPAFSQDAELIRRVRKARGANFSAKGFMNKAETAMPLILPVLISSFRRADELTLVMESRGYRAGAGPFAVKKPEPQTADWAALLVCAAVCAMQIIIL